MSTKTEIRQSSPADNEAIKDLYPAAFPEEDLLPLVRELLSDNDHVRSYAAIRDGMLVAHAAFTTCTIAGRSEQVALLGPVAVHPHHQRQALGTALIQTGIAQHKQEGTTQILVLGDPAYYTRLGFIPEHKVSPPYTLPQEWQTAWQSLTLQDQQPDLEGTLTVPTPWQQPALWLP